MDTSIAIDKTLQRQEPLQFPVLQPEPTNEAAIISSLGDLNGLNSQVSSQEQQVQQEQSALLNLTNQLAGRGSDTAQLEQQAGITQKQQDVLNLQNQLRSLQNESQAIPMQLQEQVKGRGVTQQGLQPLETSALRNNAIQSLSVSAQLQAQQGNLALAQQQVDRAINLKYSDLENGLKVREQIYQMNKDLLERTDKKRADALNYAIQKQKEQLAEKKANDTAIQNMIIEATPNAPQSIIANAKKIAENGGSKLAVAQALGVYGGDYLKRTLLEEQIKTERAQRRQIEAKTSELGVTLPPGLKATSVVYQPTFAKLKAKEQTQAVSLDNLIRELNYYKKEINAGGTSGGVNLFGSDAATLASRLNSLLFAAAQAEGTGALQAADRQVLEQSLPNPTTLGGAFTNLKQGGLDGVNSKLNVQIQKYTDNMGTLGLSPTYNEFTEAISGQLPPPGVDISTGTDTQGNMQFSLPTSTKKF